MYSTRNLIANGGFSRLPSDALFGWKCPENDRPEQPWRRISVPDASSDGFPQSGYAAVLEATGAPSELSLSQCVRIENVPTRRFAVRFAARAVANGLNTDLIISVYDGLGEHAICQETVQPSSDWERHRAEFELPCAASRLAIEIKLQDGAELRQPVAITDVRLVGLLRSVEDIAIRFDTRSDIWRASSRLRGFMLEDYLHLLGCRTSINRGRSYDLYVCQKVYPWLALIRTKLARKKVIFDLDDNDLLISNWRAANIRGFARTSDAVSVGSEFLQELARNWTSHVFLLDNPVDILDADLARDDRPWGNRLVWFGMPENRWMLDRLGLDRSVTTITRGGNIEYELKSVDEHLAAADLALLPVFLNEATRAKNANRLVKCVGLGLPFLASDTEENRRAMWILRLPVNWLVAPEEDWNPRIDEVGRNYAHYRQIIAEARPRVFELYGVERIAADWLQFCAGLIQAKATRHDR